MDKVKSKVSVPTAVPAKSFKKYYQSFTSTLGFMKPRPVFLREYIPQRSMNIDMKSFIRANPMPVPIFGRVRVHNRAFYVPFRCVTADFNSGIENTLYNYVDSTQIPSNVPVVTNDVLRRLFIDTIGLANPLIESVDNPLSDRSNYDFNFTDGTNQYYRFTDLGLDYVSVLYALGYKINWNPSDLSSTSALPLMCYSKVMLDWYYPSSYFGSSEAQFVDRIFKIPVYNRQLDSTMVKALLDIGLRCCYDNDYFTSGWDNPIGPNEGVERSLAIDDITNDKSERLVVVNDPSLGASPGSSARPSNGTPSVLGVGEGTSSSAAARGVLTQYVVNALRSLTDYTLRHRLSGVRALDRYLTEYNIKLKDEIMARSMYLGDVSDEIEFYDVFSNSDTLDVANNTGRRLGDFAGRGQQYNPNGKFKIQSMDEFGMVIIVNTLVPEVSYPDGVHREMMHISYMDFLHSDFDHMIVQPISKRELYVPKNGMVQASTDLDGVWAFTSKYIEYNIPKDIESGLYISRSRAGLLPCYTLKRDLSYLDTLQAARIKHNIGFVVGEDADSYNRIFYVDGKKISEDQFNSIFVFEVTNDDFTLPPYESIQFEHSNKEVEIDVNGSKLN